jgi:outer membrane lipoprotein-sorting protein
MTSIKIGWYGLVLCLAVHSVGCTRVMTPRLGDKALIVATDESNNVISRLRERGNEIRSFRSLYRSRFSSSEGTWTLRQAVAFQKPDSLRIDTLALVGLSALSLAQIKGKKAMYLDLAEKKASVAHASSDWSLRYLKLPLTPQELMALITGRLASSTLEALSQDSGVKGDADSWYITQGNYLYAKVNKKSFLLDEVQLWDQFKDKELLSLTFKSYKEDGIPNELSVVIPKISLSVNLVASSSSINPTIPDSTFEVEVPPDFTLE